MPLKIFNFPLYEELRVVQISDNEEILLRKYL